jgi:hypothetical protein
LNTSGVITHRIVRWCTILDLHGYLVELPVSVEEQPDQFVLRARRPIPYGDPTVVLDIGELWSPRVELHGLGLEADNCYLLRASWNAQIGGRGPEHTERLDVDHSKPRHLIVHRHPYSQAGDVREPSAPLMAPEHWLQEVEQIVSRLAY